jgi:hypothetical protein
MNLIERAMRLDPKRRQVALEAMEYTVHAAIAGRSTEEILLAVRRQINGKLD